MFLTKYHAKYYAHSLTRFGGTGIDRISQGLFNASVDLNPHQVEGALFALRSPLSQGALLADEVGLGKTIQAGLLLCQYWSERKRRLLVICPAALRKQWQNELEEKFAMPACVLDTKEWNLLQKKGSPNPFSQKKQIVIVSYHFASRKAEDLKTVQWDLVVIDEAHKLRNSHRQSNKMGQNLRWALEHRKKVLLTATPLQNSLVELYGLSTMIDENFFGDLPTFRTLYANSDGDLTDLRDRLRSICNRSLRRDVLEFIQYTNRHVITVGFEPTDEEQKLYDSVSSFLQREDTYALPKAQKHLTVLVVRKVLASSTYALIGTLEVIRSRLVKLLEDQDEPEPNFVEELLSMGDVDEETIAGALEDLEAAEDADTYNEEEAEEPQVDVDKLKAEIEELERFIGWARGIGTDTKTKHLISALETGYRKMHPDASKKAVIFTESKRTLNYLKGFLEKNGYLGKIATFAGGQPDPDMVQVYDKWIKENRGSGKATGSRAVDIRQATVDFFRDEASIFLATEAAAEGMNLQFCSLLINFDLPWNPQRVEQRIGRIHRYGQKFDVVVLNFLNERNAADRRVYELLQHKFHLFDELFGASDGVLGSLESAVGLERRILDIYQRCRTPEEIDAAFKQLQEELDEEIQSKMAEVRSKLLEHFDDDVRAKIKIDYDDAKQRLDEIGRQFWSLSKVVLGDSADFDDERLSFWLRDSPVEEALEGLYFLNQKIDHRQKKEREPSHAPNWIYRLSHPLGEYCLETAKSFDTPVASLAFDLSGHEGRLSALEPLKGRAGWLNLTLLRIESLDREDYLLFSAVDDSGKTVDPEVAELLFRLKGENVQPDVTVDERLAGPLEQTAKLRVDATLRKSLEENNRHFHERREQLHRWADDVTAAAERELKLIKAEMRAAEREASVAESLEEKRTAQARVKELNKKRRKARSRIFEVEDDIEKKRDDLIHALEKKLAQKHASNSLFTIRWSIR